MNTNAPTAAFRWPTLPIDKARLLQDVAACEKEMVSYHLGAKAPFLGAEPIQIHQIDCSGYVRWAIYRATGGKVTLTDGSVQQHEQIAKVGFKLSDSSYCSLRDGVVRIAFLPPKGEEPGHVALFLDGESIESHGGAGPDRRQAGSLGWLPRCAVYVLTPPEGS